MSSAVLGAVRRDERLIDLFLRGYKDRAGHSYRLAQRPDQINRDRKAIDCIAVSEDNETLAIEHTLVEPFEGQMADNPRFLAAFERFHHSAELAVANLLITVLVPVGAIPNGVDWNKVGEKVLDWFRGMRLEIPVRDDEFERPVPDLGFDLTVRIETMAVPDSPGVVVVGRLRPKERSFSDVLRKALTKKLPKLVKTPADRHILLVEDASIVLGLTIFPREIDAVRDEFLELHQVDSVWLAHTPVWESEKVIWFFHVWPDGVQERFTILDE